MSDEDREDEMLQKYLPQWGSRKVLGEEVAQVLIAFENEIDALIQDKQELVEALESAEVVVMKLSGVPLGYEHLIAKHKEAQ